MTNKQIAYIIALTVSSPLLLAGWYFTEANQYLYVLGLIEVIGIILNVLAAVSLIYVIPKFEDDVFVDTVTEIKKSLDHWLKYPVYLNMFAVMAALMYFGHLVLFTLFAIGLATSLAIRAMSTWAVEAALKGAQE